MDKLESRSKESLIEVINIGAENASKSLSKLVESKVRISVPDAIIDNIENVAPQISHSNEVVTIVLLKMGGEIDGVILLAFPPESAFKLAKLLTGGEGVFIENDGEIIKDLSDMEKSALMETGNILAGTSLTALSNLLDMNLIESVPESVTDMLGSAVNSITAELGASSDAVLLFKVDFAIEDKFIDGNLFFVFNSEATQTILQAVEKKDRR